MLAGFTVEFGRLTNLEFRWHFLFGLYAIGQVKGPCFRLRFLTSEMQCLPLHAKTTVHGTRS